MKKTIYISALAVMASAMAGCNSFLDDNRYPLTSETDSPLFWSETSNCDLEADYMYNYFSGYGQGNTLGSYYFSTLSDDQAPASFPNWNNTSVPASSSNWNSPYERIRHAMYIIKGVESSSLSDTDKGHYIGIARMNRAYQFWTLVKMYGDVTWVDDLVEVDSEVLYGPRTNRDLVMDYVVEDLDYAIANIKTENGKQVWSKDLARAIKSDVCLYEGTFCKYRTLADNGYAADPDRATRYLNLCAEVSKTLLENYPTLSDSYRAIYNSSFDEAKANPEIIFMKGYPVNILMHSTVAYTCSSTTISGITKDAFDNYLFIDGKPLESTSCDKSDVGEVDEDGNYSIQKLLDVRDGRLAQTTDPCVYYTGMTWVRDGSMALTSSTGYGVSKFDNTSMPLSNRTQTTQNITTCPIYWASLICCNYAEAKAELGTITDADLDLTINKLYARAGLPSVTVSSLSAINDKANNMGVSSLLWEIRRNRRCELIMDKDYRYYDLVRWHQLELLDNNLHPNIFLGANMTAAPVSIDNVNGYVSPNYSGLNRVYEARQYLYPIPSQQNTLTDNALGQNPGW
ncbi:MAG: RagB/SusD family nutrient uptake outer membrane protein [Bacteroidales bacterium]|nr:RagB/SusD family nutrient uptake outer membrane protein [Bacteroidales bacterium]